MNDLDGALCVEYVKNGQDFWFGQGEKQTMRDIARARAICAQCPVSVECLANVLDAPTLPSLGVWARYTAQELDRLRNPGEVRVCAYSGCGGLFHVRTKHSTRRFCNNQCVANALLELEHAR
jgi:predicted RNA-binding Zn ribbon-like protein